MAERPTCAKIAAKKAGQGGERGVQPPLDPRCGQVESDTIGWGEVAVERDQHPPGPAAAAQVASQTHHIPLQPPPAEWAFRPLVPPEGAISVHPPRQAFVADPVAGILLLGFELRAAEAKLRTGPGVEDLNLVVEKAGAPAQFAAGTHRGVCPEGDQAIGKWLLQRKRVRQQG